MRKQAKNINISCKLLFVIDKMTKDGMKEGENKTKKEKLSGWARVCQAAMQVFAKYQAWTWRKFFNFKNYFAISWSDFNRKLFLSFESDSVLFTY